MSTHPKPNPKPRKPSEFLKIATDAGANSRCGHGSRVVIHFKELTLGFSRQGDKEYTPKYAYMLRRAFAAAGLLILIGGWFYLNPVQ